MSKYTMKKIDFNSILTNVKLMKPAGFSIDLSMKITGEAGNTFITFEMTNLDLYIKRQIKVCETITDNFNVYVCLRDMALLKSYRKSQVTIEILNDNIHFSDDDSTSKIEVTDSEFYPVLDNTIDLKDAISVDSKVLLDAFEYLLPAVSNDPTRLVITSILLSIKTDMTTLVSTDGRRMHLTEIVTKSDIETDIMIPADTVNYMLKNRKFFNKLSFISVGERYANIDDFTFKLIEGAYPNYRQVIPVTSHTIEFETKAIESIPKTTKKSVMGFIDMLINENGTAFYFSENLSNKETTSKTGLLNKTKSEVTNLTMLSDFFSQACNTPSSEQTIQFKYTDNTSPIQITCGEYLTVIMPYRGKSNHHDERITAMTALLCGEVPVTAPTPAPIEKPATTEIIEETTPLKKHVYGDLILEKVVTHPLGDIAVTVTWSHWKEDKENWSKNSANFDITMKGKGLKSETGFTSRAGIGINPKDATIERIAEMVDIVVRQEIQPKEVIIEAVLVEPVKATIKPEIVEAFNIPESVVNTVKEAVKEPVKEVEPAINYVEIAQNRANEIIAEAEKVKEIMLVKAKVEIQQLVDSAERHIADLKPATEPTPAPKQVKRRFYGLIQLINFFIMVLHGLYSIPAKYRAKRDAVKANIMARKKAIKAWKAQKVVNFKQAIDTACQYVKEGKQIEVMRYDSHTNHSNS